MGDVKTAQMTGEKWRIDEVNDHYHLNDQQINVVNIKLVGGLEHFLFSHILGMSSSQLTNIFQRGSNHQPDI